jgi:NLP protein GAF domain
MTAHATDVKKGMECVVKKYGYAGSNVFSGDPMTATKGASYVADKKFEGYVTASKDPKVASFAKGTGLIGRAWEKGSDFAADVQKLDGKKFLRLEAAKKFGVKGTVAILAPDGSVVEFFSGSEIASPDIEGIKACFK